MARRSRSPMTHRPLIGLTAAGGALVTLGVVPVAGAPVARAEFFDDALPVAAAPLADFLPAPAAALPVDLTTVFTEFVATPLHTGIEAWISSDPGKQIDGVINTLLGSYVIGDGAPGTADNPTGGAGGWLFGDGGAGWNSSQTGVAGGDGGAAGIFGNGGSGGSGGPDAPGGAGGTGGLLFGIGGDGGNGGSGAAGGHGGDGGNGPGLFGIGGRGGNAGMGDKPTGAHPLPALGGAGGNGGLLGGHGGVGRFGTLAGLTPITPGQLTTAGGTVLPIGTTGTWFTDGDGRVVLMHGVNQVQNGKVEPYEPAPNGFDDANAAFLAANGVNAVRVGIQWAGVEPEPGVIDYAYLATIEQTVQTLAKHGIVSLLDMHQDMYSASLTDTPYASDGAPAWAVQTGGLADPQFGFPLNYLLSPAQNHAWDAFWSNAKAPDGIGLENHYAKMWQAVAGYFNSNPHVLGYEIMNEPWPGTPWLPTALGFPAFDTGSLAPFYDQVSAAIRSVDPATTVFYEPTVLFSDVPTPINLGTIDDPHTAFSFHDYCITESLFGTNLGCGLFDGWLQDVAFGYAMSQNIPAMITEWGNTTKPDVLADTMNVANRLGFGWLFWENNMLIHDISKPPVGDNVNAGLLAALAQPAPQVVGGTPGAWSFTDGTFTFSYSTAMASGQGNFAAGTETTISVPAVQYPNGYQVSVTGGQVVSPANAPALVIAADGGAQTVSVTVRAAP